MSSPDHVHFCQTETDDDIEIICTGRLDISPAETVEDTDLPGLLAREHAAPEITASFRIVASAAELLARAGLAGALYRGP